MTDEMANELISVLEDPGYALATLRSRVCAQDPQPHHLGGPGVAGLEGWLLAIV